MGKVRRDPYDLLVWKGSGRIQLSDVLPISATRRS